MVKNQIVSGKSSSLHEINLGHDFKLKNLLVFKKKVI